MRLWAIRFEDGSYYVSHEGLDVEKVYTDNNINCVIGIGKEANAKVLAGHLTRMTGKKAEAIEIERETKICQ